MGLGSRTTSTPTPLRLRRGGERPYNSSPFLSILDSDHREATPPKGGTPNELQMPVYFAAPAQLSLMLISRLPSDLKALPKLPGVA